MTYTDNPNEIVLLNDKNIVQSLTADLPSYNGIPSQKLFKATYDVLSLYDTNLSGELGRYETAADLSVENLCIGLSSVEKQLSNLSDWISSRVEISVESISAALSVQQTSATSISNRVDSMSSTVNSDYVHVSGDTIKGDVTITGDTVIKNALSVCGKSVLDGKFVQGWGSSVGDATDRGVAMGVSASVTKSDAFVWNGDRNNSYESQGATDGTFNINPESGVNGFFIGARSISTVIHDDTQLSVNDLTSQIHGVSVNLSTFVDARRTEDKIDLSAKLSAYSETLCSRISSRVDENRTTDKADLSLALSSYSNSLCSDISSTVMSAGYALYDKFEFTYDDNAHIIWLKVKDQLGRYNPNLLSIDSTDFIKNRILDSAEVTRNTAGELVLRLYWEKPSGESEGKYTDIKISDLTKIYKSGDGISITQDLSIAVNETVAREGQVNYISAYVRDTVEPRILKDEGDIEAVSGWTRSLQEYADQLSAPFTGTIHVISNDLHTLSNGISGQVENLSRRVTGVDEHVGSLQSYADSLSGFGPDRGVIPTINDNIEYLSNVISGNVNDRITANETNIGVLQTNFSNVTGYVDRLSSENGIIDTLSGNIDNIYVKIRHEMAFMGHIKIALSSNPQPWSEYGNQLSSIFKHFNLAENNKVKNGSVYDVTFVNKAGDGVDILKQQYYDTDEPGGNHFRISDGDYLIVHNCDDAEYVNLDNIGLNTVRVIAGAKKYEIYQLSAATRDNYIWLSGGNTIANGHAVSGGNEFLGENEFEQLSACNISASWLSAGSISVDWANLIHSTGFSLYDLSAALSSKIWIDDQVSGLIPGHTSDLSIVKIRKDDFDSFVALSSDRMSANVLYVVDSDYIDAYGQAISNVVMSSEGIPEGAVGPSEAANKTYTDYLCGLLCGKISGLSDYVKSKYALSADVSSKGDLEVKFNTLSTYAQISAQLSSDGYALQTYVNSQVQSVDNKLSALSTLKTEISALSTTYFGSLTSQDVISTALLSTWITIINVLSDF